MEHGNLLSSVPRAVRHSKTGHTPSGPVGAGRSQLRSQLLALRS